MVFGFGSSSTPDAKARQTKLNLEPIQIRDMPDPTTPAFDEWVNGMFKDGQELIESMDEWHKHSSHCHGTVQCLTLPTSSSGPQATIRSRLGIKDFWCGRESFHTSTELAALQSTFSPTPAPTSTPAPTHPTTHPSLPNRRSSFGLGNLRHKRAEEEENHIMNHGHANGSESDAVRALKMMRDSPECVYERFRRGLLQYHSQNERDYIESCREAEQIEVFRKHTAEVWRLTYVTPPPTNPRTFVILLLSREITHSPVGHRQFMNISIPFLHPSCPPKEGAEKNRVRGRYVSVERVTEMDEGKKVQWRMCTSSDAGGNIPRSMTNYSLPGKIAEDVPSFLEWMIKLFPEGGNVDSEQVAAKNPQSNSPTQVNGNS